MDQEQKNAKQQITDRLKEANNVLVTVSNNPSVDQLSAAIGLTLLLNKLGKHATAVFSGAVPSTLEFLQPEKTLEHNTDSLRDFIISLDKAKADKLRYKVEEKTVKIFITPYRTSLSGDDLEFSHGDFNVDAVVALGVHQREELDSAIASQGRILHDATIISINNKSQSDLGTINWHDDQTSSLCEMLVGVGETMKKDFLDAQMATAFLTGIVAETERFRNEKTTPQTMTVAGKLMSAGANQQLIASELSEPQTLPSSDEPGDEADNGQDEGGDNNQSPDDQNDELLPPPEPSDPSPDDDEDGTLRIAHAPVPAPEGDSSVLSYEEEAPTEQISQIHIDEHGNVNPASQKPEPAKPQLADQADQAVLDKAAESTELPEHPHVELSHRMLSDPAKAAKSSSGTPLGEDSFLPGGDEDADSIDLPPVEPAHIPLLHRDEPAAAPSDDTSTKTPEPMPPTLDKLEAKVDSPHTPAPSQSSLDSTRPDLSAARDAVAGAAQNSSAQTPLQPIAGLNAMPIDLTATQNNPPTLPSAPPQSATARPPVSDWKPPAPAPPSSSSSPPPPVPPPMMPPPSSNSALPSTSNPFTLPPAS